MNTEEKLKKLKELADAMYYAAQHLTTDASRLHKAMDEYHQFIINEYHKEEPVSEDLEEEISRCILDEDMNFDSCARHFANWQKEQINKVLLSEVLPYFMHGGEADEVVAKLDEVLNQKK